MPTNPAAVTETARIPSAASGLGYHVKPNPELQYDSLSSRKRPDFQTASSGEDYNSAHFESTQRWSRLSAWTPISLTSAALTAIEESTSASRTLFGTDRSRAVAQSQKRNFKPR